VIDLRFWMYNNLSYKIKNQVKARDDYHCTNCGSENNLVVHHVVAQRLGGSNELNNLVTVCKKCHRKIEHPNYPIPVHRNTKYALFGLSLPVEILAWVDKTRGDIPRSRFIARIVAEELGIKKEMAI